MSEYLRKLNSVRKVIQEKKLDGILITQQQNFYWLMGGRNYCNITNPFCVCKLVITADELFLIGNNVDLPLVLDEEIKDPGIKTLIKPKEFDWDKPEKENRYIANLLKEGKYGSDGQINNVEDINDALYALRTVLSLEEIQRYRALGRETVDALESVSREIKKGQSELEIAGKLMGKLYPKNIFPVILLVAFDERAHKYRHPLPTGKKLEKHAVLSVCGQRNGLIVAATRMVHFGQLPEDMAHKLNALAEIETQLFLNTRPKQKLGEILQKGINAYETEGYGPEWRLHFQGGITGYNTREHKATLKSKDIVKENQALAWNPSISGVKAEDTFLVLPDQNEIITETTGFPYREIKLNGFAVRMTDILLK